MTRFRVGEVFWVRPPSGSPVDEDGFGLPEFQEVTRGRYHSGADIQRGMHLFSAVTGADKLARRPAVVFTANNLRAVSEDNPWLDVVRPDEGYAVYHGDNRTGGKSPYETRGNKAFLAVLHEYGDPGLRAQAPPVLLFQHVAHEGKTKGFRRFEGVGIPTAVRLQTQASASGHFTNVAIELALLSLDEEDDQLDWRWVDDRRDPTLDVREANRHAPKSWQAWVRDGNAAVEQLRRHVLRSPVIVPARQREMSTQDTSVLDAVYKHFSRDSHRFEGLASMVTSRVLGPACHRGWVTKRSGDGGVDYVSRLDVGSSFASTSLVVLGQAKLKVPATGSVSGEELARVVARLRRGWVGAFVTTGAYSTQSQREVIVDEYPLVLVNGARVSHEVRQELAESGLTLEELLAREREWYDAHQRAVPPEQILVAEQRVGTVVWPKPAVLADEVDI